MDVSAHITIDPESNFHLASWHCAKIIEQIRAFEANLDRQHEVALRFASGLSVTAIGCQDPDMLYFFGNINGQPAQIIQHISQINILLTIVQKADPNKPANKIGFRPPASGTGNPAE